MGLKRYIEKSLQEKQYLERILRKRHMGEEMVKKSSFLRFYIDA